MLFTSYSYYFCTLYLQMHIMKAVVGLKNGCWIGEWGLFLVLKSEMHKNQL